MYFPYFRGRQYELLALKELANGGLLGKRVFPVVEPVKLTTTFEETVRAFSNRNGFLALVFNPAVGDFGATTTFIEEFWDKGFRISNKVVPAVIINTLADDTISTLVKNGVKKKDMIAFLDKRDSIEIYNAQFKKSGARFTLFPDERKISRSIKKGKIMFRDNFIRQQKNADYPDDEFYTDDHLFFKEEGYAGFGDYSIIGNDYRETGFAPYAVAIHIIYFDSDNIMRVKHFISDSNEDTTNVAGKFSEALTKLVEWYSEGQGKQETQALRTLLDYSMTDYYPGLPTIKKLTIMHHLELVGKHLDKESEK